MNFLEEKIMADGVVKAGDILKVDNFLNHQIDINVIRQIAHELKRRFEGERIDKVVTIEASGITIATLLGDLLRRARGVCQERRDGQQHRRQVCV